MLPSSKEVEAALSVADEKTCYAFAAVFAERSEDDKDGWHILRQIFGLHERLESAKRPITSVDEIALEEDQIKWLEELERDHSDAEFCARLSDFAWLRRKDREAATRAVRYYLDSGLALEDLLHWTDSIARYFRAYRLSTQLGRQSKLRIEVLEFLQQRLRFVAGDDPSWWSSKLIGLLYEARFGEVSELIDFAGKAAKRARRESAFRRERDYLDCIAKLNHRHGDTEAAEQAKVSAAEAFKAEAEEAEKQGGGMKSHHHWEAAVKAYRERPSLKKYVPELQKRLANAGREVLKTMKEHSHSTDVREIVERIEQEFSGETTEAAIYKFVLFPLSDPNKLRQQAEEAKEHFIHTMFENRFFDYEGRTVAIAPGAVYPDEPGYEKRIASDVQGNAGINRDFLVQSQLVNALRIITWEHEIDVEYLTSLIGDSLFIPKGRLEHYAEGLAFGFNYKFSHAALFLVPQIEAGLRQIAEQQGVEPRNLHPSGVEECWGLDRLLSEEVVTSQLGEALTFELRSLLIEEFGPKFRHNLSHGLVPPPALGGTDAFYVWWLFLRLCIVPTAGFRDFFNSLKQ